MKKKALVTLLLMALLSASLCPGVLAAGGECGENAVWSLEGGVLTVSGSGVIDDYSLTEGFTAVRWTVEQGITGGTAADTFSPAATCTRGQIVTFLYRSMAE